MRDTNYKLWDKACKSMYYPDGSEANKIHIYLNGSVSIYGTWCNDCILLQFTGLYDKNNIEIYEGDIITVTDLDELCPEEPFNCTVIWNDNIAGFAPYSMRDKHKEVGVIGNIYENPELLEVRATPTVQCDDDIAQRERECINKNVKPCSGCMFNPERR